MRADHGRAWLEHEGEPPGPEQDTADAGVSNAFHQNIDRFARTSESGFEHNKPDLHTEDKKSSNQRPDGVHGVNRRHVNRRTSIHRMDYGWEEDPHGDEHESKT